MSILIAFLTLVLVITSLFLILLVLVQLPKKEAGVGMAFGAGMSEMLLGAGSGNVLTRITKYTVGVFLVLSLILSVMVSSHARKSNLGVSRAIDDQARAAASQPVPAPATPAPGDAGAGLQSLVASSNTAPILSTAEITNFTQPLVSTTIVVSPSAETPAPAIEPVPTTPPNEGN